MFKRFKFTIILFSLGILITLGWVGFTIYGEISNTMSEDPLVWADKIEAFEDHAALYPAPKGALLFVGSSSIRFWKTLEQDMAPAPVIQHGFGGAKMGDLEFYTERLVNPFNPKAIIVFAGTNDIHPNAVKPVEDILQSWQNFVTRIRVDLPATPIYYIAITPSSLRWSVWPEAQATNAAIKADTQVDPTLHFINTNAALLNENGLPNKTLYRFDGLHLNEAGYKAWTQIIRDRLEQDRLITGETK